MEPVQVLLFVVVSVLTGLLLAVGIQVFIILHEAKKTLSRVNKILNRAQDISDAVARPVQGITNFMEGARNLKGVLDMLVNKHESKFTPTIFPETEDEQPAQQSHPRISLLQERGRRFFHKLSAVYNRQ